MQKSVCRKVSFNRDDSQLYGQNVGNYPIHHFYSQNLTLRDQEVPLMLTTCGFDQMCRGVYRVRKNCNVCSVELVREGEIKYHFGDAVFSCVPGDVFILHLGSDNRMECVSDFARVSCAGFAGSMLSSVLKQLHLSHVPFIRLREPETICRLYDRITELGREKNSKNFPALFSAGYEILLHLSKVEQLQRQAYPPLLENMLCCFETQFSAKLNLDELAARFCVSKGTIFSLFKRHLGCPPMEYLIRIRMNHALRELRESDEPIKKIAADCGYGDQLYFSQQFHRIYGVSPSLFRRTGKTARNAFSSQKVSSGAAKQTKAEF